MKSSQDRILTTHVGSLPRSAAVTDTVFAQEKGETVANASEIIREAVDEIVARQVANGVDIVSDGEMSKISYATYIKDRITGFDGDSERQPPSDLEEFPGFLQRQASSGGTPTYRRPCCIGDIRVKDMGPVTEDIDNMLAAMNRHSPAEGFMNAASPGVIALFQPNKHYATQDAYLEALAEAMAPEYKAIVNAGLVLQLDSPDLGLGRHMLFKDKSDEEYQAQASLHVDALNHALADIPKIAFDCTYAGVTTRGPITTTRRWKWSCQLRCGLTSVHSFSSHPIRAMRTNGRCSRTPRYRTT
jgi:5-methyltetrahydropteroyltriglutamate--homocysteine methyltransferase